MIHARSLAGGLLLSLSVVCSGAAQAKLSLGGKAQLQSAMQQHIDRALVGGAFLFLDERSDSVRPLYQEDAHPMILRIGEYFVLCAEFRDTGGKPINVDFYLARQGPRYVVFQSMVEDRGVLERMMAKGEAVRVD